MLYAICYMLYAAPLNHPIGELLHSKPKGGGRALSSEVIGALLWQLLDGWLDATRQVTLAQDGRPGTAAEAEAPVAARNAKDARDFSLFAYEWFLQKFGLHRIADEKVVDLIASLKAPSLAQPSLA